MENWNTTHWNESARLEWSEKGWNQMRRSNRKLDRYDMDRKSMKDRESWQGERQAYHLCVGGHKLRRKERKKKKKTGSKINREEAERRRGKKKRKESAQRVKLISGCFNLKKKQDQRQSKTVDMIQINNTERDAIALSMWMEIQCCWPKGGVERIETLLLKDP